MAYKKIASEIPPLVLAAPVVGYRLPGATLGAALGSEPTLLVFLRHFGCIFCKEMVADLRTAHETNPAYPRVLFVAHGEVEFADSFFASLWPQAQCIVDSERTLYAAFGVERMRMGQMLNPAVISCGVRAAGKGHMQSAGKGDSQQMPGLFHVQGDQVLWRHDFKHAGDHPDWDALPARLPAVEMASAAG